MAISLETAQRIYLNPRDLHISLDWDDELGRYSATVCLRRGCVLHSVVSTNPWAKTIDEAVWAAEQLFEIVFRVCERDYPDDLFILESEEILTRELVGQIIAELRVKREVATYSLPPAA